MILVLLAAMLIQYRGLKKVESYYFHSARDTAFESMQNAVDLLSSILSSSAIQDKDLFSGLSDIHAFLSVSSASFQQTAFHYQQNAARGAHMGFIKDLPALYGEECLRIHDSLLKAYCQDDYTAARNEAFLRLKLIHSDLQKLLELKEISLLAHSYEELQAHCAKTAEKLDYPEILRVYKLRYKDIFIPKPIFQRSKKLMQHN